MAIPEEFPRRISRTEPERAESLPATSAGGQAVVARAVPGPRPWLLAALLLSIATQWICISALQSPDGLSATWASVLLAVAPAPLAAVAYFAPAQIRGVAALAAVAVLVAGIAGEITHIGVLFVPALVVMLVAAYQLWQPAGRLE